MAQAYITQIKEKDTKAGKMYDFVFSDGNTVGAGKYPPKGFAVNDYVNYEYDQNGNFKNLRSGSLSKTDKPAGVPAPAAAPARTSYARNDDNRQEIISKQAALNSAIAWVGHLISADALPVPKALKTDKKADALRSILDEFTGQFYKQATGQEMTFPEAGGLEDAEAKDVNWNEE